MRKTESRKRKAEILAAGFGIGAERRRRSAALLGGGGSAGASPYRVGRAVQRLTKLGR